MIDRRLKTVILIVLWIALIEDSLLFLMAWFSPDLWFRVFHHSMPVDFDVALLRRSAGQWIAFAIAQAVTLLLWRKKPVWLAITAGVRFSDLFTDISYILAVPSLSKLGWICLLPPPVLNLIVILLLVRGYRQMVGGSQAGV